MSQDLYKPTYEDFCALRKCVAHDTKSKEVLNLLIYAYTFALHHHLPDFTEYMSRVTRPVPDEISRALPSGFGGEGDEVDWVALHKMEHKDLDDDESN